MSGLGISDARSTSSFSSVPSDRCHEPSGELSYDLNSSLTLIHTQEEVLPREDVVAQWDVWPQGDV